MRSAMDFPRRRRRIDLLPDPASEAELAAVTTGTPVGADCTVLSRLTDDSVFEYHRCVYNGGAGPMRRGLFKVAMAPGDDDLLAAEAMTLLAMDDLRRYPDIDRYLPELPLRRDYDWKGETRRISIFPYGRNVYSLEEIMAAHPAGVELADAAWMIHRLFEGLYYVHRRGRRVHGAILPCNVMYDVTSHRGILTNWGMSVPLTGKLHVKFKRWAAWYPPEVDTRQIATEALDVQMAARCVIQLLGGDPVMCLVSARTPKELRPILRACLHAAPSTRNRDASAIRTAFGQAFRALFGAPSFRPFAMPVRPGDEGAAVS